MKRKPSRAAKTAKRAKAASCPRRKLDSGARTFLSAATLKRSVVPKIPAILLEGDEPSPPPPTGPGQKYAVGSPAPAPTPALEADELPEAYGTGRVWLTARDPHCLYAHWDLTAEQRRRYQAFSTHRRLVLRVYVGLVASPPALELQVHPESKHWFVHVARAGIQYVAELGYYRSGQEWRTIAASNPAVTPHEGPAEEKAAQLATIPAEAPLPTPKEMLSTRPAQPPPGARTASSPKPAAPPVLTGGEVSARKEFVKGGSPLALEQPAAPRAAPSSSSALRDEWTPEQEQALAELLGAVFIQEESLDSLKLVEALRLEAGRKVSPVAAPELGRAAEEGGAGISSPQGGGAPGAAGFWFNVNAELVIYGATEPDAQVTIGGRPIRLRPDGTFSYRFALPDGQHVLPIAVTSSDGETRRAELRFERNTICQGEVGAHPQDPALKPPRAENVE
jgi:hypothetical protein